MVCEGWNEWIRMSLLKRVQRGIHFVCMIYERMKPLLFFSYFLVGEGFDQISWKKITYVNSRLGEVKICKDEDFMIVTTFNCFNLMYSVY